MNPVNDQDPGTVNKNTAQPLARQMLSNKDTELTPGQHEALLRVLKDTPPLWPELQTADPQNPEQKPEQKQTSPKKQLPKLQRQESAKAKLSRQKLNRHRQIYETEKSIKRALHNRIIAVILFLFLLGAGFFGWYLWRTVIAIFDYELQPVVVLEGWNIDPNDFLAPGMDTENVTVVYRNPVFTPSVGYQNVQLTLTKGWRTVDATASLCILTAINRIDHEFAKPGPELKADDFITNPEAAAEVPFNLSFTKEPLRLEEYPVGEHTLNLALNGKPFEILLSVKDTTPPDATPVDIDILIGENIDPDDFVTDVFDASGFLPVTISFFGEEPDIFGHDQTVAIKVQDHYGNYKIFFSALTIRHNTLPPVIEGTGPIVINVGGVIRYMQGVTAFDDFGRDLTSLVLVDDSGVDPFTVGVYPVRYEVTDHTGNFFEVNEFVHVLDIDMNSVNEEVDSLLLGIIDDDMTQLQKVQAIFTWVRGNITYAPSNNRTETAYEGAYRALRERRGNNYIYYSISELMLTRAGIPNIPINRIEGSSTSHRWNLVNPDDLGWHHFDSYPISLGLGIQMAFFTGSQALDFTGQIANLAGSDIDDYYTYDPSLYPEIVQ